VFGHDTYLILEVAWGLPVLALQWLAGYRLLWRRRRLLLAGLCIMTTYLVVADAVAIGAGIWTLHANRIIGWHVGDVPIEEIIFFLLTDAMVMQTALLLLSGWRFPRLRRLDRDHRPMQTLDMD